MGYRRSEYARLAPSVYLGEPAVCDWVDARFFRCPRRVIAVEGGASWCQSEDALTHSLGDQWGLGSGSRPPAPEAGLLLRPPRAEMAAPVGKKVPKCAPLPGRRLEGGPIDPRELRKGCRVSRGGGAFGGGSAHFAGKMPTALRAPAAAARS